MGEREQEFLTEALRASEELRIRAARARSVVDVALSSVAENRDSEWSDTRSVIDRLRTERDDWKRQWESACEDIELAHDVSYAQLREFARFCAQLPSYLGHPDAMVKAEAIAERARKALNWSEVSDG